MPFDGKVSDYFETKPAPVYDRDNPPTRMSEAIRMAVADVEAQEAAGIKYSWHNCNVCTAGAVCRRIGIDANEWDEFHLRGAWNEVLSALSTLTLPTHLKWSLDDAFCEWRDGFAQPPTFSWGTLGYTADPAAFKRDMLALADRLEAEGS